MGNSRRKRGRGFGGGGVGWRRVEAHVEIGKRRSVEEAHIGTGKRGRMRGAL